jgi:uncharacterized hydrophobic protein (TIGR00271 family)
MDQNQTRFLAAARMYLRDLFNLQEDKAREETTIEEIKRGVVFKGANLWILIFAILIASIGLNVNSTAVIIGAMLISPLMGPIMGIGLGAGINDFELIKKAFRNLATAAFLSIATSTIYFFTTPLHEAQSELLSRTTPTLWDVLIAFFGGMVGIIAGSRREKSNAIPGVAIATALMPPLCTAGYGLANGNLYYFVGALYLFFINSVFISVSTFLIVRFLNYPKVKFESRAAERRIKTYIWTFVIITAVPSIYLAYNVVKRTIFEQNARNFISVEFDLPETQVINEKFSLDGDAGVIDITLYGKQVDEESIDIIRGKLSQYNLVPVELIVRQGYQEDFVAATAQEFQRLSENMKLGILEDLYKKNEEALESREDRIRFLEEQLIKMQKTSYPVKEMEEELKIQYPALESLAFGDMVNHQSDTLSHAVVRLNQRLYNKDKQKISDWLRVRSKADTLIVIFQ